MTWVGTCNFDFNITGQQPANLNPIFRRFIDTRLGNASSSVEILFSILLIVRSTSFGTILKDALTDESFVLDFLSMKSIVERFFL